MKFLSLFALLFPLLFVACLDDDDVVSPDTVATSIDFVATYAGTDLAIQSGTYAYPTGAQLKTTLFQYYVSDLTLLAADGSTVPLSELELIRYGSATDAATVTRTYNVPAGDYVGLRFGLGVKPALNALDPNNFAADYILNENEFWGPGTRYVFAKIEANADLENDGTFDTGLSYHLGSDALYATISLTGNITIDGENDPRLTIVADVLKALASETETFDISDVNQQRVHGGNQAIGQAIWERLVGQFKLDLR